MIRRLKGNIALVLSALLLVSGSVNFASAATECVESSVDENGEFICTEWANVDNGGGGSLLKPLLAFA